MTERSTNLLRVAIGAAVSIALASGPASAALSLSPDAVKCRAAVSKAYGSLIATTGKTLASCHKSRDLGKITLADCNNLADPAVDPKGKILTAQTKLTDAFSKSCSGLTELMAPDFYLSCPEPCGTALAMPNPMTNLGQVDACLRCAGPQMVASLYETALGSPAVPVSKEDGKCRGAIAKGYQKYLDTLVKGRQSCQGTADKAGTTSVTACSTADPKAKGAGALVKANDGIDKSCAAANGSTVDSCASDNLGNLKTCLGNGFAATAGSGFTTAYELPATICPTSIQTIIHAGCSTDNSLAPGSACQSGRPTATTLSVGWTGIAHGADVPDNYSISAALDCPGGTAGACGDCTITGVSSADPQHASFLRCKWDPSTPCDTPFANNPACPSGGLCTYFLGAPLALSSGGAFSCSLNALATDITGTANPDAGSSTLNLDLKTITATGESQVQPCPLCIGDTTPQDGIKSGTCLGGAKDAASNPGWTCDVQAFDLTYSGVDPAHSGPSLDCPSAPAGNISGAGLVIKLGLTTGDSSLGFNNACDAPHGGLACACGVCTGNTSLPCRDNAECTAAGAGTCTSYGGGIASPREPNGCSGYTCDDIGAADRGECAIATSVDNYCDGFMRANGGGVLNCLDDDSCHALDTACPGGSCGTCTHPQVRSCFLNPIVTNGTPDTHNPVLAGSFCLPPTSNNSINVTVGSPGPGLIKINPVVHLGY